jgi:glycylpeptide N-tetradecanoyltransferase
VILTSSSTFDFGDDLLIGRFGTFRALTPPGYEKDWHIGVRSTANKLLVGLITGIPVLANVYDKSMKMAEINFLCVHKKLRAKRLAPVLIREVTRRVNCLDIWQATYTAGVKLPGNVGECRYYHRSINPQKLIDVGFSHLRNRVTMSMTKKLYALPDVRVFFHLLLM